MNRLSSRSSAASSAEKPPSERPAPARVARALARLLKRRHQRVRLQLQALGGVGLAAGDLLARELPHKNGVDGLHMLGCLVVGLCWPWLRHIPLGRLPGDIVILRENFRFFFPLTSSILVSLILSLLVWLFRR